MLPDNMLSTNSHPDDFLVPFRENKLIDYEWGGIWLLDTSHGLDYQIWRCWYDKPSKEIRINRLSDSLSFYTVHMTIEIPDVNSIGLSFDGNMRPTICYTTITEDCYLHWYDPTIASMTTTVFTNIDNAAISLDDNRQFNISNADIILAYTKENQLFHRRQRDRYLTEYPLSDQVNGDLWQIGMNKSNRFQFSITI